MYSYSQLTATDLRYCSPRMLLRMRMRITQLNQRTLQHRQPVSAVCTDTAPMHARRHPNIVFAHATVYKHTSPHCNQHTMSVRMHPSTVPAYIHYVPRLNIATYLSIRSLYSNETQWNTYIRFTMSWNLQTLRAYVFPLI